MDREGQPLVAVVNEEFVKSSSRTKILSAHALTGRGGKGRAHG
jgi:hypothetical protein